MQLSCTVYKDLTLIKGFKDEISDFVDKNYQRKCFKSQLYQIISEKHKCLGVNNDEQDAMFVVIRLKLIYMEKLAAQCEDTEVFSLACNSDKSLIEPFVCKKVISTLNAKTCFMFTQ